MRFEQTFGEATTLADAWVIIHSTNVTARSSVPLSPGRVGRMVAALVHARKVASASADEHDRIVAALVACGWALSCVVVPYLNLARAELPEAHARELDDIATWIGELLRSWDDEMAETIVALQRLPAYAAESLGLEVKDLRFAVGGDA